MYPVSSGWLKKGRDLQFAISSLQFAVCAAQSQDRHSRGRSHNIRSDATQQLTCLSSSFFSPSLVLWLLCIVQKEKIE
ncbi:hypothetical protein BCR39DRAFT_547485 [Naematelia encephala]|uniref:Uncharacterized protein n=1 Tax=Naematelia encephala TaxID=71784 RepID=A0A1Y2ANM6_9TREE|nr:hypothetical protein BCR39DRAFT_547485 [Naematelia encephala]